MFYPIKFEPIYKEMVWGGTRLREKYGRNIPCEYTGEAWDISCRKDDMSIINNGKWAGRRFDDLINSNREGYLGKKLVNCAGFPLLVKIIDANKNLSIQIHPDDDYAQKNEHVIFGKTEMWYILCAPPNASLIYGLSKEVTSDKIMNAAYDGSIESMLRRFPIKANDVIEIPAGLIHALTAGIMVLEIQQNSDTTYRLYDYCKIGLDNKPRELHIAKAVDVVDIGLNLRVHKAVGIQLNNLGDGTNITRYISNKHFTIEKYTISRNEIRESTDNSRFYIFTCVEGNCVISAETANVTLSMSESVFLPAAISEYSIFAHHCELIKSYVNDY